jgi:hypothetical protein
MGGNQVVPEDVTHVRVHESVKIIRRRAFQYCRNLVSIEMHDGVEIIQEEAFHHCSSLREINLLCVRVIGNYAFYLASLADVEFGNKLETIGEYAFSGADISNVKLPKVRVIGPYAFSDCNRLTEVELSEDLERIEEMAFTECGRLWHITVPPKANLLGELVFSGCDNLSQVDLVGGIHKTISSLHLESWRTEMKYEIDHINLLRTPLYYKTIVIQNWMNNRIIPKIEHYKSEHYALLKEVMSLLELALWKANLDDNVGTDGAAQEGVRVTRGQRKRARRSRRITSGASIVIKNVLHFLKLE